MIWHSMKAKDVTEKLGTDESAGLSAAEAQRRTSRYGKNAIEKQRRKSIIKRMAEQLCDYMVIILIIAAAVSYIVSLTHGENDITEPAIILAIVVLNAAVGVIQEGKAERAIAALRGMSASAATVIRDGKTVKINSENLVPGDIIILKSGDKVPADARILSENMLKTDESAITGESLPAEKTSRDISDDKVSLNDMHNMLWASTLVVGGSCRAVVTEIGMETQVGKIAGMISSSDTPRTPLQDKLAAAGKVIGFGALLVCVLIFIIGIINKINIFDMFMTAVSLAVAAIPEGLPAIVTVVLAIGVRKMAQKNAIVRRLPSVETLGCANVICSDKTGTLTSNKMTVRHIYGERSTVLKAAMLCSNNSDPTERAITAAAQTDGLEYETINKLYRRVREIPFNSADKFMITLHESDGGYLQIIKGAPDVIMKKCTNGSKYREKSDAMAAAGLRVIAVAYADTGSSYIDTTVKYTFGGLIGISDPLRPEAAAAVKQCKKAGIKPVMITGDYKLTACAIAREAGIMDNSSEAVTGKEIDAMTDERLAERVKTASVFARVTPEHKVRIVKAFQKNGMVTAMTGDGVNDAPALKAADIGCAMGSGTDVAKGAADIILSDDNFATIVEAVKQGRIIFENIKKTVHFLLSSNIGEILTIFTAIIMRMPPPLTAIQLLWVNLITDSLPAIALGMEKGGSNIMDEKPETKGKNIFSCAMAANLILEGIMIAALSLTAYFAGQIVFRDLSAARTMTFSVLALSQLVHSFNMHSKKPICVSGLSDCKMLWISFITCAGLQIALVSFEPAAKLFSMSVMSAAHWRYIWPLSFAPVIVMEITKLFDITVKK